MKGSAFVPGHITGFFEIFENDDPVKAGSRGAGVVLDKGVYTTVKAKEGHTTSVTLNGKTCECPVSRAVIKDILQIAGAKYDVEVIHELEIPMGQGFGASGAGALGTALAANKAMGLNLTMNQCGEIAHRAEVINRTGMGDVIAQSTGGLVIRTKPGAPGTGTADRIFSDEKVVVFTVGEAVDTKSVLLDREKIGRINKAGRVCLAELLKNPSQENFLVLSRRFALEAGLVEEKLRPALKTLEDKGITASVTMLGNSVFTLTDEPEKVSEYLDYLYIIADIDYSGARVLA
ncbi:kinase, partial [archaeon]|nr:kinase [archaeon]